MMTTRTQNATDLIEGAFFANLIDITAVMEKNHKYKEKQALSTPQQVCIILIEKSGEFLLPFLDKSDREKLSKGIYLH